MKTDLKRLAGKPSPYALLAMVLLAGCADSVADPLIRQRQDAVAARLETARAPAADRRNDSLQVSDEIWLGDSSFEMQRGKPLPQEWERDGAIALRSDNPMSLGQIAGVISAQTGIPVRLVNGAGAAAASAPAITALPGAAPVMTGAAPVAVVLPDSANGMMVAYEGKLSGLLDLCVGYFNFSWSYNGTAIEISRYQTRTFVMEALPGASAMDGGGGGGAGGSTTGGAGASAGAVATGSIDTWSDITSTLGALVAGEGSVTISQSSGTVIVTTTTDRMVQVARYIADENVRLSRQVAVTIELYSVSLDDSEAYGFNLTAALDDLAGISAISLSGPASGLTAAGAGQVTVTLLDPPALEGSTGIVQALSTLGRTTRLAQIPITTLNNRPATQRIAVDTAYVSEVQTTTSGDTVSTEVTTDTATSGINVTVLPRIMADGRVLLQYSLNQDQLLNLASFPAGENTVQLPETQSLAFSQQVVMKGGSTLVLAGFDQSDASSSARGVGRPLTWLLGGSTQSGQSRQMVVIAITPREIQVARAGAS